MGGEARIELISLRTADGVRLPGLVWTPSDPSVDHATGVVLVHGATGSLTGEPLRTIAAACAAVGLTALTFSNRGHDIAWEQDGRYFGHAFENLEEFRLDLDSAVAELIARGCRMVAVVGHSLGAIKAVAYAVEHPTVVPSALVAISPPRLSAAHFGNAFGEPYRSCVRFFEERRNAPDVPVFIPPPFRRTLLTPAAFLQRYASERWNVLQMSGGLAIPTLFLYGGEEAGASYDNMPQLLADASRQAPGIRVQPIPGAGHTYAGFESELAELVVTHLLPAGSNARSYTEAE